MIEPDEDEDEEVGAGTGSPVDTVLLPQIYAPVLTSSV